MSEHQVYEFQAVDRPLTQKQIEELRAISTRAKITPTSFTNIYNWGDFKGDPNLLMEKYFDAFAYIANWGTRWFMLRLPHRLLDSEIVNQYCVGDCATSWVKDEQLILSFISEDEYGEWIDDDETWLSSLIHIRAELARGDLRCLYLAWLFCAQECELEEDDCEPPVPPNLTNLSTALKDFAMFLRLDNDLIEAAAQTSPNIKTMTVSEGDLRKWIAQLTSMEKDDFLFHLIEGDNPHLGAELRQRFERECNPTHHHGDYHPRTVSELLQASEALGEERRIEAARRNELEQVRQKKKRAAARKNYLESIAGKANTLWNQIDQLIATKQPKKYDKAVSLIQDLRDLAEMEQTSSGFSSNMNKLLTEHSRKPSFIRRLREADLGGYPWRPILRLDTND